MVRTEMQKSRFFVSEVTDSHVQTINLNRAKKRKLKILLKSVETDSIT